MTPNTERQYAAAEIAFLDWCREQRIRQPAKAAEVASYLRHCRRSRGASTVPVHAATIGKVYRARGWPLDIKLPVIQKVIKAARERMRQGP